MGETSRVDQQGNSIAAAQFGRSLDIPHRNGLASGRVVGDGQHDTGDLLLGVFLEDRFQLFEVHLSLEGKFPLSVGRRVDRTVDCYGTAKLDVPLCRVEMGVARNDIALFEQGGEDDVLGSATLVCRQEIGHSEDFLDYGFEPVVGGCTSVTFIGGHHGPPLAVAHRLCSRIGQQVDHYLVGAQLEEVVMSFTDPSFALFTRGGADCLRHLDFVRFAIGKLHIGVCFFGLVVRLSDHIAINIRKVLKNIQRNVIFVPIITSE